MDPSRIDAVADEIARLPEVAFVAVTTGVSDVWVNAMFRSNEEVYDFISKQLGQIRGIRRCETSSVLRVKKRSFAYGTADRARPGNGSRGAASSGSRHRAGSRGRP